MLNVDKYRKEIDDYITTEKDLGGIDCKIATLRRIRSCGDYECDVCTKESLQWLFSEYEPPVLENGDGLKPGDWIMVRNDDDSVIWYKNRFVCYYNATFFVVDDIENDNFNENGTNITGWKYARLPEDGE